MSIHWTPELSVGVEEIDNQHKELYRNVELFFEQIRKGNGQWKPRESFLHTWKRM